MNKGVDIGNHRDKVWFERHWLELHTAVDAMAAMCGASRGTIYHWRRKLGIVQRPRIGHPHTEETKEKIRTGILGRKHTGEAKRNMSKAQKGHPVSDATKRKQSIAASQRFSTPEARKAQSERVSGFRHTDAVKRKISEASKAMHADPEIRERRRASLIRYWTDEKREERSRLMREVARRPGMREKKSRKLRQAWADGKFDDRDCRPKGITSIEQAVIQVLDELNISYIFQYSPKGYRKVYDFYIPNCKLLIETHGDYWHDYTVFPKARVRDEEKKDWAKEHRYSFDAIWEHEMTGPDTVSLLVRGSIVHATIDRLKGGWI